MCEVTHEVFSIEPYFHQPVSRGAVLVFELRKRSNVTVCVRSEGRPEREVRPPSRLGMIEGDRRLFRIPLDDLEPDRLYSCSLRIKPVRFHRPASFAFGPELEVPAGELRTLGEGPGTLRVTVFQDLHGEWSLIHRAAESRGAEADLLFFNGDSLGDDTGEREIRDFLSSGLGNTRWKRRCFHYVRGNHECRGRRPHLVPRFFPTRSGRLYYSFIAGPAFFLVLDTGEDKEDHHEEYGGLADFAAYRSEQREWFSRELESEAARDARFRIVVMHIPPRDLFGRYINRVLEKEWAPVFNRGNVDLVLSGHNHVRNRTIKEEWANCFNLLVGDTRTYTDLIVNEDGFEAVLKDGDSRRVRDSLIKRDNEY